MILFYSELLEESLALLLHIILHVEGLFSNVDEDVAGSWFPVDAVGCF